MSKLNKMLSVLLVLLLIAPITYAKEERTLVRVGKVSVYIDYSDDEIVVKRETINNEYIVRIYSKKDGKLLETHREVIRDGIQTRGCGQESTRDLFSTFYVEPVEFTARATCRVYDECSSYGNRTHILEIISADHYISSDGVLEQRHSNTNVNRNIVRCSGTLEADIPKSNSDNSGISVDFFFKLGYEVSSSTSYTFHVRKAYYKDVEFR